MLHHAGGQENVQKNEILGQFLFGILDIILSGWCNKVELASIDSKGNGKFHFFAFCEHFCIPVFKWKS